ncbi:multidrug resistance-associated protein 5-like [Protopterus annectens]|uniref:multidrug resistance-associated protein 5-like n=1 Tax=Protopterus annectens TaxID=7888 RepID=UPI001CFA3457|nr:multidrug resistance-associated protein 5-like [Protopterus annectens]
MQENYFGNVTDEFQMINSTVEMNNLLYMYSHPVDNAGFLSYMTFTWLTPLAWKTFKYSVLNPEDLWKVSPGEASEVNSKRFLKLWQEELCKYGKKKASMLRVIWNFCQARCLLAMGFLIVSMIAGFCCPAFLIRRFLQYSSNAENDKLTGLLLVLGIFLLQICQSWILGLVSAINYRTGARLKAAVISLSFEKVLQLRNARDVEVGKLINMCTTDSQYIRDMVAAGCVIACVPLILLLGLIYTIVFLGAAGILALAAFIFFYPSLIFVSRLLAKLRKKCVSMTDRRVQKMTELLKYIKFIKVNAWEKQFSEKITDIRNEEHKLLEKAVFAQGMISETSSLAVVIATISTITVHMAVGYGLDAARAFTVVSVFTTMINFLKVVPSSVKVITEASLSVTRFQTLFLMDQWKPVKQKLENTENAIEFRKATLASIKRTNTSLSASWGSTKQNVKEKKQVKTFFQKQMAKFPSETDVKESLLKLEQETAYESVEVVTADGTVIINSDQLWHYKKTLFSIDLNIQKGKLIGICGRTGSGKSSLISAILGQMHLMEGTIAVNGSFAYSTQQAWILNMSVRENIILGKDYNEGKYKEVLEACCLALDISVLPQKDMTEIRDQGSTLSRGQRHRISLARTLYSDQDIILLDDPLSAVDVHVGAHLFNNAIKKCLRGKTVLLVTNQLQHLVECDEVIFMKNGLVAEYGTHNDLMNLNEDYAMLFRSVKEANVLHQCLTSGSQNSAEMKNSLFPSKSVYLTDDFCDKDITLKKGEIMNEMKRGGSERTEALHLISEKYTSLGGRSSSLTENEAASMPVEELVAKNKCEKVMAMENQHLLDIDGEKEEKMDEDSSDDEDHSFSHCSTEDVEKGRQMQPDRKVKVFFPWSVYKCYIMAAGGYPIFIINMILFVLTACSMFSCTFWLSYWIKQGSGYAAVYVKSDAKISDSMSDNPRLHFYEGICVLLLAVMVSMKILRGYVFFKCAIKASSKLHDQAFDKVIKSPVKFFDTTPLSTILQNFSKIMDEADSHVAPQVEMLLQNIALITVCMGVLAAVFPLFLLSVLPLSLLFWAIQRTARVLISELNRLNSVTQAPIMSLVTCTLQGDGIPTIHGYGQSDYFLKRFQHLLDENQSRNFLLISGMRWLSIRLDEISTFLITITSLIIVFKHGHVAGLALSYAMQLTGLFQQTTLLASDTETRFVSVVKLINYMQELELESRSQEEESPSPVWPQEGGIKFEGVEMRYRDDLPLALKKISFEIKPREKIRIVGRTGSGKSSIGATLFRLAELAGGSIFVDSVDISKISAEDLRTKLTLIPQNPVLFRGTIRFNLDPLDQYEDWQIWEVLERTHMKECIAQLPLKIYSNVRENGENFSIGERQLLCVARALLQHRKILLLDEATSSIDNETELLIQQTISEDCCDCTILTISHRLHTALNSDRIMVLDQGQVAENDIPAVLLSRDDSLFRTMVAADISRVNSYE